MKSQNDKKKKMKFWAKKINKSEMVLKEKLWGNKSKIWEQCHNLEKKFNNLR